MTRPLVRVIAAVVCCVVGLTGCDKSDTDSGDQTEKESQRGESVSIEEALSAFRRTVEKELLPRIGEMDYFAVGEEAGKLYAKHVTANKELFAKEAERILANLPRFELGDRSEWKPLYPESRQTITFLDTPATEPAQQIPGFISLWNPVLVARICRSPNMMYMEKSERHGKRVLIESVAPPKVMAADSNPVSPTIAFVSGDEVFLVALRRGEDGSYRDNRVQWVRRTRSKPDATPRQQKPSSAKEVMANLAEAVWRELLPRIDELTMEEIEHRIGKLAHDHVVAHNDLLGIEADRVLEGLARFERPDLSQWELVRSEVLGLYGNAHEMATTQPALRGLVTLVSWNPKAVASAVRTRMMMNHLPLETYVKHQYIDHLAPPTDGSR